MLKEVRREDSGFMMFAVICNSCKWAWSTTLIAGSAFFSRSPVRSQCEREPQGLCWLTCIAALNLLLHQPSLHFSTVFPVLLSSIGQPPLYEYEPKNMSQLEGELPLLLLSASVQVCQERPDSSYISNNMWLSLVISRLSLLSSTLTNRPCADLYNFCYTSSSST